MTSASRTLALRLLFLAAVAILAYAPSLKIGLIADDYPNISQARTWGSPSGFPTLLADSQFRLRSTSYWTMYALWATVGLKPPVYRAASLMLHIMNCWLLFAVCLAWPVMRPAAFYAAAFFAVHEGHQEAVMWFSAINELLMFFFGLAALVFWTKSCGAVRPSRYLEAASAALFTLALLSKESAVFLFPLFLLPATPFRWKRLWPHAALCALAAASIISSRGHSFRFNDGSFSLAAPFWITWPQSYARLLWIWGLPAVMVIFWSAPAKIRRGAASALLWIGIALVPYSFLTYSTRIPSRQTYLATAGLALLVGLAAAQLREALPGRTPVLAAVFAVVLAHNIVYLWMKKRSQFEERAAPTDQLIALARGVSSPIYVQCFPLPPLVAEEAVRLAVGRAPETLLWNPTEADRHPGAIGFCYRPNYTGAGGRLGLKRSLMVCRSPAIACGWWRTLARVRSSWRRWT